MKMNFSHLSAEGILGYGAPRISGPRGAVAAILYTITYTMFGFGRHCGHLRHKRISILQIWLGTAEFESYLRSQSNSFNSNTYPRKYALCGSVPRRGMKFGITPSLPEFPIPYPRRLTRSVLDQARYRNRSQHHLGCSLCEPAESQSAA